MYGRQRQRPFFRRSHLPHAEAAGLTRLIDAAGYVNSMERSDRWLQ
jgi:hypothetical protein